MRSLLLLSLLGLSAAASAIGSGWPQEAVAGADRTVLEQMGAQPLPAGMEVTGSRRTRGGPYFSLRAWPSAFQPSASACAWVVGAQALGWQCTSAFLDSSTNPSTAPAVIGVFICST